MPGLEILDVALGLTLVYLLLASICSLLRERIEAVLRTRAVNLECCLREMLNDPQGTGVVARFFEHPLIDGLFPGDYDPARIGARSGQMPLGSKLPSYIPARNFAQALIDVVARGTPGAGTAASLPTGPLTVDTIRQSAALLDNVMVQQAILSAIDHADGGLDGVRANLESWFNSAMERLSGQYRRRTQSWILLLSLAVSVAVNANTLTIIERLSIDPALRHELVAQAATTEAAGAAAPQAPPAGLPLGWAEGWPGPSGNPAGGRPAAGADPGQLLWYWWLHPLLGLLLTALAVSMGAPFWFDALNRILSVRSTLKPEEGKAGAAPAPAAPPVVQLQMAPAPAAAAASAPFQPQEWSRGNPQEGVL
jgi:hypothetical protein